MRNDIIQLIKKTFNENINSHAFLIETDNIDLCLSDIKKIIFEINNISVKEDVENFPDLKIIKQDGREIKREQINEVLELFQTYPVEFKHRYYIILNSDKMNQSSSNTILKFLEEPDNSIIGFFITNNKSAMLNTIISRCQHYKIIYNEQKKYDIEKISTFIKGLENKKLYKRIEFLSSFISKDRNDNLLFLKSVSNYILENNISNKDVKILVKRLTLLDNVIEKLLKNANQELVYLDLARNWK